MLLIDDTHEYSNKYTITKRALTIGIHYHVDSGHAVWFHRLLQNGFFIAI